MSLSKQTMETITLLQIVAVIWLTVLVPFIFAYDVGNEKPTQRVNLRGLSQEYVMTDFHDIHPYIIGGYDPGDGRYPYFTLLAQRQLCGAALIAPDVIVTAAHCRPASKVARVGSYLRRITSDNTDDSESIRIGKQIQHPLYIAGQFPHDIMVMKLIENSTKPIVKLNNDPNLPNYTESNVVVLGMGDTQKGSGFLEPEHLQAVELQYLNNTICDAKHRIDDITNDMMCAADDDKDACIGDSGGPLIFPGAASDTDVLVGIVSWGRGCADDRFPGVYSRISYFYDWLIETTCSLSTNPPDYFNCGQFLPSSAPTSSPVPTQTSSSTPSVAPSSHPSSVTPSFAPSNQPSPMPTQSQSATPSVTPSSQPIVIPSVTPSPLPSAGPTGIPSINPTTFPSSIPSFGPSITPTDIPSDLPSLIPSFVPSDNPTMSIQPSSIPSESPSGNPTGSLSLSPTIVPSSNPSQYPSTIPSFGPSAYPTSSDKRFPPQDIAISHRTIGPTNIPSTSPSTTPTIRPTPNLKKLGWSPHGILKVCEGDCDTDDDCEGDLVCFHRFTHQVVVPVPGCGKGYASPLMDFCIRPELVPTSTDDNNNIPWMDYFGGI